MNFTDREQRAINFTIGTKGGSGNEGGFSDRSCDKGGATFSGFTLATVRELSSKILGNDFDKDKDGEISVDDLKKLTYEDLEEMADTYYNKKLDLLIDAHDTLSIKTFDTGFNCGEASGVKLLQSAVNRTMGKSVLVVDGVLGPNSIAVINSCNAASLFSNFIHVVTEHYQAIVVSDPTQQPNLHGWLLRATRLPN